MILFTKDQISDMKSLLRGHKNIIIGIDRTFNLSFYYATIVVFKNLKVVRADGTHPLFIGPVFLHRESTFEQYSYFLSQVKTALQTDEISPNFEALHLEDIAIGSDEEKALTKAIQCVFPSSRKLHCYLHLKENVQRKMIDTGVPAEKRRNIIDQMFATDGIIKCDDEYEKAIKINRLEATCFEFEALHSFIVSKIKPALLSNQYTSSDGNLWTNNNCESMNNVIKIATDWKIQKVPQLINVIKGIVQKQYLDLKASIYGSGNFKLSGAYTLYKINFGKWKTSNEMLKTKYFQMLLEDSKRHGLNEEIVKRKFKGVAAKPNQRRRTVAERVRKGKYNTKKE